MGALWIFASAVILLLACWALVLAQVQSWPSHLQTYGVLVKDYIAQSTVFLICAMALVWRVCDTLREGSWRVALWLAALAVLFLPTSLSW